LIRKMRYNWRKVKRATKLESEQPLEAKSEIQFRANKVEISELVVVGKIETVVVLSGTTKLR
jgi:hypothetical protein